MTSNRLGQDHPIKVICFVPAWWLRSCHLSHQPPSTPTNLKPPLGSRLLCVGGGDIPLQPPRCDPTQPSRCEIGAWGSSARGGLALLCSAVQGPLQWVGFPPAPAIAWPARRPPPPPATTKIFRWAPSPWHASHHDPLHAHPPRRGSLLAACVARSLHLASPAAFARGCHRCKPYPGSGMSLGSILETPFECQSDESDCEPRILAECIPLWRWISEETNRNKSKG